MPDQAQKMTILQELNEAEFRQEVLIPLLKRMGYQKVRERHGSQEYGKDITFYERSEFGGMYYAVVAKVGTISGAASGKQNLDTVKTQIDQAFDMPFEDVEDKESYHIDRVIVWTTGKISDNAEKQILNLAHARFKYVIFRGDEATVELLERFYPSFFTVRDPVVSDYYNAVKTHYSHLEDLRTLGTSDNNRQLPVIFVEPTFSEFAPRRVEKRKIEAKREKFSFSTIQDIADSIALIGGAGAGKTTLLRRLLLGIVERNEKEAKREPIPVLVRAKQIDFSLETPVERLLVNELNRFNCAGLEIELETRLKEGKVIVLLDGLDELETREKIDQAVSLIRDFHTRYSRTRILLTSRYLSALEQPGVLPRFRMFHINDLEPNQMVKFVENWYGRDTEICRKLIRLLTNPGNLRGLPATPMTVALIAILHERSPWQEVPANQTELVSKYIELALGRWDASKDVSVQFEYSIKKFVLQQISWDVHQRNELEILPADFDIWVNMLAEEHGLHVDLDIFRREIVERSELLFKNDKGNYEFKHRSFQDYFVGAEINRLSNAIDLVVSKFLDPWWSQAVFFASGLQPDNAQYVDAILKQVVPEKSDALFFATSMGELIQATFMATKQTKLRVVRLILEHLVESWEYICEYWNGLEEKPIILKDVPAHILFLALHDGAVQSALGSVTLSPVLSEMTTEFLASGYDNLTSSNDLARQEWQIFFLAAACAQCDENINDFLRLFQSNLLIDPGFVFFGSIHADEISTRTWLSKAQLDDVKELFKKLSKKWRDSSEYRKQMKKLDIIPLPPPGSN